MNENFNLIFISDDFNFRQEMFDNDCNSAMLIYRHIYNVYNCITLTIFNGYAQLVGAFKNQTNQDDVLPAFIHDCIKTDKMVLLVEKKFENASSNIDRRCDPAEFIQGFLLYKYLFLFLQ